MRTIYKIISMLFIVMAISSCGEEEVKNIMGSPVEFTINLNAWDSELRTPLAVKTYTVPRAEGPYVGLGGLLVISNPNEIIASNIYGLYVYDLACPHERNRNVRLTIDNNTKAKCDKCGSVFNIINGIGNKESGPSETGLQRYQAMHSSINPGVFRITR